MREDEKRMTCVSYHSNEKVRPAWLLINSHMKGYMAMQSGKASKL